MVKQNACYLFKHRTAGDYINDKTIELYANNLVETNNCTQNRNKKKCTTRKQLIPYTENFEQVLKWNRARQLTTTYHP